MATPKSEVPQNPFNAFQVITAIHFHGGRMKQFIDTTWLKDLDQNQVSQ